MWFLINTIYACSSNQQIKHSGSDLYICDHDATNGQNNVLTACTINQVPTLFEFETSMDGIHIIHGKELNYVWDIADKTELILYYKHGGENQLFELRVVTKNQFLIVNRGWCIEYEPNNRYIYKPCTGLINQLFEFVIPTNGYSVNYIAPQQEQYYNYSYQYTHPYPYRTHYSFFM